MRCAVASLLALAVLAPGNASAHQKSVSYSKWTLLEAGAVVQAKIRWLELTSLPTRGTAADAPFDRTQVLAYVQSKLALESPEGPCEPVAESGTWLPAERGWARLEWEVRCAAPPARLRSQLFSSLPNHVHLATIVGPTPIDVVLSPTSPTATITEAPTTEGAGFSSYLRLGIEHIVTGWDHLAFLFLLIVVAYRLRDVVVLVTGFTVGHSVTLAAASLGLVVPHARAVEATIAASILIVALENVGMERVRGGVLVLVGAIGLFVLAATTGGLSAFWGIALFTACYFALLRVLGGDARLRWAIACLFGLVHGLGFSGVLLEQALPKAQLVKALFGFNVGVELGQLAIVVVLWPLLQWLRGRDLHRRVVAATSLAGTAVGTFALVVRAFG